MSDVKDILGISGASPAPPARFSNKRAPPRSAAEVAKKPEGMSREVFALMNGTPPPPVVPALSAKAFKERRKIRTRATPWRWKPFTNSARDDNAVFNHWVKGGGDESDEPTDYYYAKLNKKLKVLEYTEQEYDAHFKDAEWSREETDHLFELVKRYDLRWFVILDRYSSEFPKRTVEDMKERYYKIEKQLSNIREPEHSDPKNMLAKYNYNKEQELKRKKQQEILLSRTKDQVKEIEDLLADYKKIEAAQKKQLGEKRRLIKATDSATPTPPSENEPKRRKTKKIGTPSSTAVAVQAPAPSPTLQKSKKERTAGVYVRSSKMTNPLNVPARTARQVDSMLDELGIPTRPMPTAEICKLYNELRHDLVLLVDLESLNKKRLYDLELLKAQRDQLLKDKTQS